VIQESKPVSPGKERLAGLLSVAPSGHENIYGLYGIKRQADYDPR
jgi:hypothetical protein